MPDSYLPAPGEIVRPDELKIEKAKTLAIALGRLDFVRPIECRRNNDTGAEIVVFDAEIEVGQVTVHDIHGVERLAVQFDPEDERLPEVYALRADFPYVPHLNLKEQESPRSLCLYEDAAEDVKLRWTAASFIAEIRSWLALTARGELHAEDQHLEPLLTSSPFTLVVPFNLLTKNGSDGLGFLYVAKSIKAGERVTLIADHIAARETSADAMKHVAIIIEGTPQQHGIIRSLPLNLGQLNEFLAKAGIDLLDVLRRRILKLHEEHPSKDVLKAALALVLVLPKKRIESGEVQAMDRYAILVPTPILKIGEALGIWDVRDDQPGRLLVWDPNKKWEAVPILPANLMFSFSRELAARQNGLERPDDRKIVAVGQGALGSQLFLNLTRMGFGIWTVVDNDLLLPHNLARHALPGGAVGLEKAPAMAYVAGDLLGDPETAKGIVADVLRPSVDQKVELSAAYREADVLLDTSTSIAVARHLARDVDSSARRVSMFLNPKGTDLVMLAEDQSRETPVDYLEMIYYRHLINTPSLRDHLQRPPGRMRYGNSCRDVNVSIPQDLVALHAAVAARALRQALDSPEEQISIWRTDELNMRVRMLRAKMNTMMECRVGTWRLCTDKWLVDKVLSLRKSRLPNETGGILVGAFDNNRKVVYVVDMVPSPPDSKEWPWVYIRGCQGLPARMKEIQEITGGQLEYVGEWHSHTSAYDCAPSDADIEAFGWLRELRVGDGLPALMMIAAENTQAFYVDIMTRE